MTEGFAAAFDGAFDTSVPSITDFVDEGEVTIGGITLKLSKTDDAFDVEIPEAKLIYLHMLGHDSHSIIASVDQAKAMIDLLREILKGGYAMILSSHHAPETLEDVIAKISYLDVLVDLAQLLDNGEDFKGKMLEIFPDMGNLQYLDMTAANLYQ
jgi:hypothetical protein